MTVNLGLGAGWEKANPSNSRKENPKTQVPENGTWGTLRVFECFGVWDGWLEQPQEAAGLDFLAAAAGLPHGDLVVGLGWALKREQGSRTPKGRNYLGGGVFVLV
jgi:hypothetical protein